MFLLKESVLETLQFVCLVITDECLLLGLVMHNWCIAIKIVDIITPHKARSGKQEIH